MPRTFWSCFSHQTADWLDPVRGYDDTLGRQYEYDSHVVNHNRVAVGDVLVIRDSFLVLGYGFVESVDRRADVKIMLRCPECHSAGISARKNARPTYRCNDCRSTFEVPLEGTKNITTYVASYGTWWFPFDSPVPVRSLERAYAGKDRQNAIRRLDEVEARALLAFCAGVESILQLELLESATPIAGGHVQALLKVRVGQQQFRERMLERFGSTCAVSGAQPQEVLDAAHLVNFAVRPEHRLDGGLLLRADLHRMFDRLLLTFDPTTWTTHIAPQLLDRFEGFRVFEDQPMVVPPRVRPDRALLQEHLTASRARWKAAS